MPEWKTVLQARLAGLKFSPAREAEILEELSAHLDERYAELVRSGLTPDEATRTALDELREEDLFRRGLDRLKQAHVTEPVTPGRPRRRLVSDLRHDLRYAVRMFSRQKGFTLAAVSTLALGIGANAAIFSLVNATLLQRLPVRDSAELVYVFNGSTGSAIGVPVFSYPEIDELRANDVFDGLLAWGPITASLNADAETDLIPGAIVTGNFFDVLGVRTAQGRMLAPTDDVTPGAHPVAVISHRLWQERFHGRDDIIGRPVLLNGQPFTIVGVTPPGFSGAQLGVVRDLFVPMMMQAVVRPPRGGYSGDMDPDLLKVRGNRWLFAIGRLKPGVSRQQAEVALSTLANAVDQNAQNARPGSPRRTITAVPVDDGMPGQRAQMVPVAQLLMGVVGVVLLIACANVANLLLSRAASRRREVAVRLAIGASRWRLVRQFLTESVLLALAGGAAGVLVAWLAVRAFRAAPPPAGALPIALDFALDGRVLLFTLVVSVLTGLLFGLAPALRASAPMLVPALRDDAFVPDERRRRFNVRKVLVVVEVALSLMLLIAAGLFVRSLQATREVSPGFDVERLVSAPLNINLLRYTRDQGRQFYAAIVERTEALPGVESASVARTRIQGPGRVMSVLVEGRAASDNLVRSEGGVPSVVANRELVSGNVVGPEYFRTMGIALMSGRDFGPQDTEQSPRVVIVNEAFAAMHFAGEPVIGRRLSFAGSRGTWHEITGVVKDSKYASLSEDRTAVVYLPLSQNHETGMFLHVRTAGDPALLVSAVRREIQALEPNLPVPDVVPMADTIRTSLYAARMGASLIAGFGALALVLAAIGIYGVLAFSIARRTREIGIRLALGAAQHQVFGLVVREGMWLVAIGVAVGLTAAAYSGRFLSRFLFGVSAMDVVTFAAVPLLLAGVALIACLVPARRAMNVAPTEALRYY